MMYDCSHIRKHIETLCDTLCNYYPERENTSHYIRCFFFEGILNCDPHPIGNMSSLTLLLFFASLLKETLITCCVIVIR